MPPLQTAQQVHRSDRDPVYRLACVLTWLPNRVSVAWLRHRTRAR